MILITDPGNNWSHCSLTDLVQQVEPCDVCLLCLQQLIGYVVQLLCIGLLGGVWREASHGSVSLVSQ